MIDAAKALPTVPTVVKKSLVSKLAEIVALVGYVPKNGRNAFHAYNYSTESDVLAAVRGHLSERQIMIVPSVVRTEWTSVPTKSGSQRICTLTVLMTILDGESDARIEYTILGEGADANDKSTYKAMTGAMKYGMLKLFCIPTGDDPERDDPRATLAVVTATAAPPAAAVPAAAEVSCPACGQLDAVMLSKFGPGYVCFLKKGGCGAKFLGAGAEQPTVTIGRRTATVKAQLAARVAKAPDAPPPDDDAESAHITPWETMSRYLAAANLHGVKGAAFLRRITGKALNDNINDADVAAVVDALDEMGIDVGGEK